jgi:hypothetical protein
MGTSTSNKGTRGQGTPLVPTWLEPDETGSGSLPPDGTPLPQETIPLQPIPPPADKDRFRIARTNFTRFVNSGGHDRASLGHAVSGYVTRTAGGARRAAHSMGASRNASVRLLGFLVNTAKRGAQETLRSLHLENLVARPIQEIFLSLADYICPETGRDDEGIAKAAFIDTIAELTTYGITDLESLNIDQIQTVFELYATHAIELRIQNDIGMNTITLPPNVAQIPEIQRQLHEFIRGAVDDALTAERSHLESLTPDHTVGFVDKVYEKTFTFLVALGNSENE